MGRVLLPTWRRREGAGSQGSILPTPKSYQGGSGLSSELSWNGRCRRVASSKLALATEKVQDQSGATVGDCKSKKRAVQCNSVVELLFSTCETLDFIPSAGNYVGTMKRLVSFPRQSGFPGQAVKTELGLSCLQKQRFSLLHLFPVFQHHREGKGTSNPALTSPQTTPHPTHPTKPRP